MKKLLLFLFVANLSFGQTDSTKNKDDSLSFAKSLTNIQKILPSFSPQSPNAAAIKKYGDIPTRLFTGAVDVSIPIYTIQSGDVTVPITLSYHTGGIKVNDVASSVGLGWALNTGGQVARTLNGLPDEQYGYLDGSFNTTLNLFNSSICSQTNYLLGLSNGTHDKGADLFSYSLVSGGGKFMLKPENAGYQVEKMILPEAKHKITYLRNGSQFDSFNIIDEAGMSFQFNDFEMVQPSPSTSSLTYRSNWLLNSISDDKALRVVYEYNPLVSYTTPLDFSESKTLIHSKIGSNSGDPSESINNPIQISLNESFISSRSIKTIFFDTGKIEFVYEVNNRQDVTGDKALDKIEVYSVDLSSTTTNAGITTFGYTKFKTFDLVQTYFVSNRLKLERVDELDGAGVLISRHALEYEPIVNLPSTSSRSRDVWGYYNGKTNSDLIEPVQVSVTLANVAQTITVGTANRTSDENYMVAHVLRKITYPTGGYTTFDFEANRYSDAGVQKQAGGLRIKEMKTYESASATPIIKTYRYGQNENGNGVLNVFLKNAFRRGTTTILSSASSSYKQTIVSSGYSNNIFSFDGSAVIYDEVAEYSGTPTSNIGKTISKFDVSPPDEIVNISVNLSESNLNQIQSNHWRRGQLTQSTVLDAAGSKKSEQINQYTDTETSTTDKVGILLFSRREEYGGYVIVNCQSFLSDKYQLGYYTFKKGYTKLTSQENFVFDDTNSSLSQSSKTETDYSSTHLQPIETRFFASDGSVKINKYKYPSDYPVNSAGNTTGYNNVLFAMNFFNKTNSVLEEVNLYKSSASAASIVIGGTVKTFKLAANPNSIPILDEIKLLEIPENTLESNFTYSNLVSNNFVTDSRYVTRARMLLYDANKNVLEYALDGGANTKLTYQTLVGTKLSLFLTMASSSNLNAAGSSFLSTAYSYIQPELGIRTTTQPNGLSTTYDYDAAGRLKNIRDHAQTILKSFEYNFKLGANGAAGNFVREITPRTATTSDANSVLNFKDIAVFDGLGRMSQKIAKAAAGNGVNDVVTNAMTFNQYGATLRTYLPFSNTSTPTTGAAPPSTIDGDTYPYAENMVFDNSPLQRVKQSFEPGQAWRTNNKFNQTKYLLNSTSVKAFKSTFGGAVVYNYAIGSLNLIETVSEQGSISRSYTTNDGKTILNEVYTGSEWLRTAFVYDERDRLRYVLQPMAYEAITASFLESDAVFSNFIFGYQFDSRNRTMRKHVPGGGWTSVVFDKLDRPVAQQDAQQLALNKWSFTKYDAIGRALLTGSTSSTATQSALQTYVNGRSAQYETIGSSTLGYTNQAGLNILAADVQQANYFDSYAFATPQNIPFNGQFGTQYTNVAGLPTGSMNFEQMNNDWLYTVNYYDNDGQVIQQRQKFANAAATTQSLQTDTQYGHNGEVLQTYGFTQRLNGNSVHTKQSSSYDTRMRPIALAHGVGNAASITASSIASYVYDDRGRLLTKQLMPNQPFFVGGALDYLNRNTNPNNTTLDIARKAICILPNTVILPANGVYTAQVNPSASNGTPITGLQTIDYAYHLRGGLRGINLDATGNPSPNTSQGDLFAYKLDYETAGQWDGNIGRETWKSSRNTGTARQYNFQYDASKRLKSATYSGGSFAGENYGIENINYDKNGNILTFWRQGVTAQTNNSPTAFGYVDKMQYFYSGNRLSGITDAVVGNVPVDDFRDNTSNADYTYWPDGSIKSDGNRGINLITWDTFLKKVKQIDYADGRWIKHFYDGSGNRLKTTDSQGIIWEYIGGQVYKNGVLYQVNHEEGRVVFENGAYQQEFSYDDHLGNSRVSFRANGNQLQLTQENAYYPFGLSHFGTDYSQANNNQYQYLGKEKASSFGLNTYSLGYREYDALNNRFWSTDPKPDVAGQESLTPYQYSWNNPVLLSDPDGDCATCIAGAIIGGLVAGAIKYSEGGSAKEIAISALGGVVSGAITGSGVGLIASLGIKTVTGVAAVNAATGYVASGAESAITQYASTGKVNTGNVVRSAMVGAVTNTVGGFLSKPIEKQIVKVATKVTTLQVGKNISEKTIENVAKKTTDVVVETTNNKVGDAVKNKINTPTPKTKKENEKH